MTLAALTVFYRDFKHIVPFLTMIMMYITPVIYPVRMISPKVRIILSLNPMFGIVGAYRSAILGLEWDIALAGDLHGVGPGIIHVLALLFPQDRAAVRRLRLMRGGAAASRAARRGSRIRPIILRTSGAWRPAMLVPRRASAG